jgi:hypothetical protein
MRLFLCDRNLGASRTLPHTTRNPPSSIFHGGRLQRTLRYLGLTLSAKCGKLHPHTTLRTYRTSTSLLPARQPDRPQRFNRRPADRTISSVGILSPVALWAPPIDRPRALLRPSKEGRTMKIPLGHGIKMYAGLFRPLHLLEWGTRS